MTIATTIDRTRGTIFTTAGSVITDQDWMRHHQKLCDHPHFEADFDQLLDFRQVEDCRLTAEIMRVTAVQPLFGPNSRQAFVAVNNLTYGMCRMFEILSAYHTFRIEVFRDYPAAREWLALDRDQGPLTDGRQLAVRAASTSILSLCQTL